jgi:tripartite-type tricarboxylate transporter receptor subunit TctC
MEHSAADYPARPVTLVVPYPAGGERRCNGARVVAQRLSDALHQNFIVDNRGRWRRNDRNARRRARGRRMATRFLLGHTGTISINPSLYVNLNMDPRKDFAPIGLIASMPIASARPSLVSRPKTVSGVEVISLAKKDAGKLNIGTSPVGTGGYMSAELFQSGSGIGCLRSSPTRALRR